MTPKVVAIIQGRMASTRLPGKTLVDIAGQPFLGHVIDRVRASRLVREVIVSTTMDKSDDVVSDFAASRGVRIYRGSTDDVLDRFYQAALQFGAGVIARITADDPFKDPDVIDLVLSHLLADGTLDYASNTLEPSYPEGLDVEAFTWEALSKAWHEAKLPSEREHVTPYIWKNPDRFRLKNVCYSKNLSHLRWTLDYEDDLRFTREIYSRLYHGQVFRMAEILQLLDVEPQLVEINAGIQRNIGYQLSVKKDKSTAQT